MLFIILLFSRRSFNAGVRPFHSGICVYIASFAPYSLLKAIAVVKLLQATTQSEQLTAGLTLNASFMLFFWLGFGGKMALIQLWMHLISQHTTDGSDELLKTAERTWKFMRLTVFGVCTLYGIGFISLVGAFAQASRACSDAAGSTACIPMTASIAPSVCRQVVSFANGIVYYEGLFAAVVVVVFTFYALMFNGLVYAMLTSDATFSNLTQLQVHPQPLTFEPQPATYLLQPHPAAAHADHKRVSSLDAAAVRRRLPSAALCNAAYTMNQVPSAIVAAVVVQDRGKPHTVAHIPARTGHQARRHQRFQLCMQGCAGGPQVFSRCS